MPPETNPPTANDEWESILATNHGVEGASYSNPMSDEIRFQKAELIEAAIEAFWTAYTSNHFARTVARDAQCIFLQELVVWLLTLTDERRVLQTRQLADIVGKLEGHSSHTNASPFEGARAAYTLFALHIQKYPDDQERLANSIHMAGRTSLAKELRRTEINISFMQQLTGGATKLITNAAATGQLLIGSDTTASAETQQWSPRFQGDIENPGAIAPLIDDLLGLGFEVDEALARSPGRLYRVLEILVHEQHRLQLMTGPKEIAKALQTIQQPTRLPDVLANMMINIIYQQPSETQRVLSVGIAQLALTNPQLFSAIDDQVASWASGAHATNHLARQSAPVAQQRHVETVPSKPLSSLDQLEQGCQKLLPLDRITYICQRDLRGLLRDAINGSALIRLLLTGKLEPTEEELYAGYFQLHRLTHSDSGGSAETDEISKCLGVLRGLTGKNFHLANAVSTVQALQQAVNKLGQVSSVTIVVRPARQVVVTGSVSLEALLSAQDIRASRILLNDTLIVERDLKDVSVKAGDLVEVIVPISE
jgi:hypothetical protein